MPVTITATGSDDNVLEQVAEDGGQVVTHTGSTRNRIEQVAADAGVPVPGQMSDRNAIEALALILNAGGMVWALDGAFGVLAGVSAATVTDDWVSSAVATGVANSGGNESFIAGTSHLTLIDWSSGVRWIEAPEYVNGGYNVAITQYHIASLWMLSVRREGENGTPGDTHWNFYVENAGGGGAIEIYAAEGPATDVPAIGIDGETGEVHIAINGVEIAIAQPGALPAGTFIGGGIELFSTLLFEDDSAGAASSVTMAALAADFAFPIAGGYDMQGVAL